MLWAWFFFRPFQILGGRIFPIYFCPFFGCFSENARHLRTIPVVFGFSLYEYLLKSALSSCPEIMGAYH